MKDETYLATVDAMGESMLELIALLRSIANNWELATGYAAPFDLAAVEAEADKVLGDLADERMAVAAEILGIPGPPPKASPAPLNNKITHVFLVPGNGSVN